MSSKLMPHQSAPIERTLLSTSASIAEDAAVTASIGYYAARPAVVQPNNFAFRQQYATYRTYSPASRTTCQHGAGGVACWTPTATRRY